MSEEKGDAGIDLHHAEQCSKVVCDASELERTIDWKQGLAIALGVPLLILPSLGYFPLWVSSAAIIVWGLSVFQGFMQNLAYGELATAFPHASGLPGFAQNVFKTKDYTGKYDKSKLIGGFSAWSYWFAWNPVLAIFAILVGGYMYNLFPILAETFTEYQLSLVAGIVIFGGLILVNYRGLEGGALAGYILAAISLLPLIVITLAPFATGDVVMSNITSQWLPADWAWDAHHILILFGLFAMAQWSACAWETAAIYGPEYKNPGSDVPKALFVCGVVCFFSFVLVQAAVIGVLGVEGTIAQPISPMIPVAQAAFGSAGAVVAIVMLIAAMVLIIQTAYLGSARAMHSMATEGNLPKIFGKLNSSGTPIVAMVVIGLFNLLLISMGTPTAILAASAIGYTCANGISLFAYVKAKLNPEMAALDRPFKAPTGWKNIALLFGIFNIPLCLVGVVYLNSLEVGWTSTWVGFIVLALYLPMWFYSRNEAHKEKETISAVSLVSSISSSKKK
ncbi:APC family permease [Methanohalophilus portucalensis]|uniref:APC family permease n=2 Tax=Methanohalophilus portucalensis TaxID=39664 RepID=A0A1L9C6A9_9EURY|nr:APC family permease [Methanohalophilus portucalensis]ATU08631.1 amino acid permease [Methanohalophilus portucalensis]OJH50004.1 amino acid permease-associated region [Methanohalophilus portucalensis FDF-1]RNI13198.1 APC family permease [Methanohalophilus portucalensis FDF-1]SMH32269.1 dimethylamine:proton symporter, ABT family [Methanohalophilus portucalensis FDF-1]